MHIGGGAALEAARRRAERAVRTPAFGIAVITPIILAGAVGASAPSSVTPVRDSAVTPLAAVEPSPGARSGASVVAVTKTPTPFHIAAATVSAPPPAVVVNSPGALRIPAMALSAYRNAERMMAAAYPGCGVSWNLLAGIGRIESMHANGGATDARGTAVRPIYGPALDGTLPGNEIIVQSRTADRVTYARAMGPMQFLPGTWSRYASDGDGDGKAEVQNLYDSSLAAARYLCSGGMNLRNQAHVMAAILRYNNSVAYARNVLGWAAAYATGVVPWTCPRSPDRCRPSATRIWRTTRARTRVADKRPRPACHRSSRADARDGANGRRQPDPDLRSRLRSRPDPGPAAWTRGRAAGATARGAGAPTVAAAVDAAAAARVRGVLHPEHRCARCAAASCGGRGAERRPADSAAPAGCPTAGAVPWPDGRAAPWTTAARAAADSATATGAAAGPARLTAGQRHPSRRHRLAGDVPNSR